jgi:hypothetical protein
MFFDANAVPPQHGNTSFWLDLADRVIKFLALLVGAAWTWMHYQRSRTYAQKLELEADGNIFFKESLYLEVLISLKNLGASRHALQKQGSSCSVWAVLPDLTEKPVLSESVFELNNWIEPGEPIQDSRVFRIDVPIDSVVWLKIGLRVVSEDGEWNLTRHIRVEIVETASR